MPALGPLISQVLYEHGQYIHKHVLYNAHKTCSHTKHVLYNVHITCTIQRAHNMYHTTYTLHVLCTVYKHVLYTCHTHRLCTSTPNVKSKSPSQSGKCPITKSQGNLCKSHLFIAIWMDTLTSEAKLDTSYLRIPLFSNTYSMYACTYYDEDRNH